MIEVTIGQWRHGDIVTSSSSFDCAADPVHDGGIFGETAFTNFAPANESFLARVDEFFHAPNEITFELDVVFEAFLFQAGLAFDAVVPIVGKDFVAADMNV